MTPKPYYDDGIVTLYHGRCEEILPLLPKSTHVITDPPYDEHTHESIRTMKDGGGAIALDFNPALPGDVLSVIMPAADGWVIAFCAVEMLGEYQRHGGEHYVRGGFWHRINGTPQVSGDRPAQPGEGLAILRGSMAGRMRWNGGGHAAFWETCITAKLDRVHKTQKPETLMIDLVAAFTRPGETICDPFAGSGTTLVAAKRLGRRAIGIECELAQCREARKRLRQDALPMIAMHARTKRKQSKLSFEASLPVEAP
jgi:site-specific DNA-methyltransferase (adenine-specific)